MRRTPVSAGEPESVRVLVAIADSSDRRRIVGALRAAAGFTVVGEVMDGLAAIHTVEVVRPDLILLANALPLVSGVEAVPAVRRSAPRSKIVLLTRSTLGAGGRLAMRLGAHGYLSQESPASTILEVLCAVVQRPPHVHEA